MERRLTNSPQLAPRELQDYIRVVVDQVLDDDFRFRFRGQEVAQSLYGVGESTAVRHSFMYCYAMLFEQLRCEMVKEQVRIRPHSEERMGRLRIRAANESDW